MSYIAGVSMSTSVVCILHPSTQIKECDHTCTCIHITVRIYVPLAELRTQDSSTLPMSDTETCIESHFQLLLVACYYAHCGLSLLLHSHGRHKGQ